MSGVIFVCSPLQAEVPDTEITRHPFCSVFQHSEKFTSMHARPCMWLDPIDRSRRIIRYGAPGRFVCGTRIGGGRLEISWHWMSFLNHVASTGHRSLTGTRRPKQERRCDLRPSSHRKQINIRFPSYGICPV